MQGQRQRFKADILFTLNHDCFPFLLNARDTVDCEHVLSVMGSPSAALALREAWGDRKPPDITRKITACVACRKLKVPALYHFPTLKAMVDKHGRSSAI